MNSVYSFAGSRAWDSFTIGAVLTFEGIWEVLVTVDSVLDGGGGTPQVPEVELEVEEVVCCCLEPEFAEENIFLKIR